jgi:hypothetical protein
MRGFPPYSYDEYKALLESSAMTYDESKVGSRSVNNLSVVLDDEESEVEQSEFSIHVTKGKMPGSSMNKETWNSLDKEEQAILDKLKDSSKRKILQYAKDRAGKKEKEVKINMVEATDTESPPSSEEPDDLQDNQEKTEDTEEIFQIRKAAIIKNILEEAKSEAHPGDVRRMMGKKTAKVKFTRILGDEDSVDEDDETNLEAVGALLDEYWKDEDQEDFHRGD